MISWKELVSCIERLEELPNGGGPEIEFHHHGAGYGITSHRGLCDLGKFPDAIFDGNTLTYSEEQAYKYRTLNELGKARDVGFSVEENWESFEEVCIKPDFENCLFEEIYAAYEKACKRKKNH